MGDPGLFGNEGGGVTMNRRVFFKAMMGIVGGLVIARPVKAVEKKVPVVERQREHVSPIEDGPGGSIHVHGPNATAVKTLWEEVYRGFEKGLALTRNEKGVYHGVSRSGV